MPIYPSMCVSPRDFWWQVWEANFWFLRRGYHLWLEKQPSSLNPVLCSALSWTGLLHQIVEPKGRPSTEDHPVALPCCERHDPQRCLLLQDRRLQGAPRAAHGRQTRPLLLPVQHRLPGRWREEQWLLGNCFCSIFAKCIKGLIK